MTLEKLYTQLAGVMADADTVKVVLVLPDGTQVDFTSDHLKYLDPERRYVIGIHVEPLR